MMKTIGRISALVAIAALVLAMTAGPAMAATHATATQASKAAEWAKANYGKLQYDQPKRMSAGFADASSFTHKAYLSAGYRLGGFANATTAAEQYRVAPHKGRALRKGDLVFKAGTSNGRYMNIYHVGIYGGDGYVYHMAGTRLDGEKTGLATFKIGAKHVYYGSFQ